MMRLRYIDDFPIDVHEEVIRAYLIDSKSHREIQREILYLPAPDHGGGFVTMGILHHYDIHGEKKGIMNTSTIEKELEGASDQYSKALMMLSEINEYIRDINRIIDGEIEDFNPPEGPTEIPIESKRRISQRLLRRRVIGNYSSKCALCDVKEEDLLICSHIKPWYIDEENRLNPRNAICLCVWHDRLFDKGYYSLNDNFEIVFSKLIPEYISEKLKDLEFHLPGVDTPKTEFIRYHRENILRG